MATVTSKHDDPQVSPTKDAHNRRKRRQFLSIAEDVMLCEQGDPKFTALVRAAGGWSIRKMTAKLFDRPPDQVMKEMGKGEEGVELTEEEWKELSALMPYITWAWNCHGPKEDIDDPFDYDSLTREGFETFLESQHDEQVHNHYDPEEARENRNKRREEKAGEEKRQLDIESYKETIRSRRSGDKSNSSSIKSRTRVQLEDIPKKPSSITIPKV